MLTTIFVWLWMGISSYLWGSFLLDLLKKNNNYDLTLKIIFGLCALTVYAQIFSLFYKVGLLANIIVLMFDLIIFVTNKKKIKCIFFNESNKKYLIIKLIVIFIIGIFLSRAASQRVNHYDTYLYHAQSVRWIEEYGVVKGIGNLHYRLAYNSSIFSLEALFSMKFLFGQSLHSVNGFIVFVLTAYSILSLKIYERKKVYISDFTKLAIPLYFVSQNNLRYISSLGSDFATLGFIIYIVAEWISNLEDDKDIDLFCILSLLCVYVASIKLSGAPIAILVIYPAYKLTETKQWKKIFVYISLGLLIIAPFLIRNVIISGYILYPLPEIDLFDVDWKMLEGRCIVDRKQIKVFGWANGEISPNDYDKPFSFWYPYWKRTNGEKNIIIFWISFVSSVAMLVVDLIICVKNKQNNVLVVTFTIFCCLLYWLLSAPLFRYGYGFILLSIFYFVGRIANRFIFDKHIRAILFGFALCFILVFKTMVTYDTGQTVLIKQVDYDEMKNNRIRFGNYDFYYPSETDQSGYHCFPAVLYESAFSVIEFRTNDIKDGFKLIDR